MDRKKEVMMRKFVLAFAFIFLIFNISFSVAEGCCKEPLSGGVCLVVESASDCSSPEYYQEGSECNYVSFCQQGCCYDESSGHFNSNVLESDCSYDWVAGPTCDIEAAELGCCLLQTTSKYSTYEQCNTDSESLGLSVTDWNSGMTEIQCVEARSTSGEGACVSLSGQCSLLTIGECIDSGGDFFEGFLCTSEAAGSLCEMTEETGCFEGRDGVYFKDSCGNRGNIYDSSRVNDPDYWNEIILESNSCGAGDSTGNAGSNSCGNCDRIEGSICSDSSDDGFTVEYGSNYCKPLNCIVDGVEYKNGESWCTYQGKVGESDDIPGSLHFENTCNFGVVETAACKEARREICLERTVSAEDNFGVEHRRASCMANDAISCIELNREGVDERIEKCNEAPNCRIENVKIGGPTVITIGGTAITDSRRSGFEFNVCVPKHPIGWDITRDSGQEAAELTCNVASQRCKVIRKKETLRGCQAVVNQNCLRDDYVEKMNNFCTSLGDCGMEVNLAGDIPEDNIRLRWNGDRRNPNFRESYLNSLLNLRDFVPGQGVDLEGFEVDPNFRGSVRYEIMEEVRGFFKEKIKNQQSSPGGLGWRDRKCDDVVVNFQCKPWLPETGGDKCEECNGINPGGLPCTEYQCSTFGSACELINVGTEDQICTSSVNDLLPPLISFNLDSETLGTSVSSTSTGIEIETSNGECLSPGGGLEFSFETDKASLCRYSFEKLDYEEMEDITTFPSREHSVVVPLTDPSHGFANEVEISSQNTVYVKCRDRHGNEGPAGSNYRTAEYCVNEGPDTFSPIITRTEPEDETIIDVDSTNLEVDLFTNEFATCRWSTEDESYDSMANQMSCDNSFVPKVEYQCSASIPVPSNDNIYYFRCSDQPWLEENESEERNDNLQSISLSVRKYEDPIEIRSILIDLGTDIVISTTNTPVEVEVRTGGGSRDHLCRWSKTGYNYMDEMDARASGLHDRTISFNSPGENTLFVECEDLVSGDVVRSSLDYTITQDTANPLIARIFQEDGIVSIITNEDAECVYTTNSCRYDFDEGVPIGEYRTHEIDVRKGDDYYIKCRDKFENAPSGCSVRVKAI